MRGGGRYKHYEFNNLIQSIHIVDLVNLLDPGPPPEVLEAASKLKYRSQRYLFLTLNKERVTRDQWIYFPDPDFPVARISEMKNFSPQMAPSDKTSLFVEFFCDSRDSVYSVDKEDLLDRVLPYFEKNGFFLRNEVRSIYDFSGYKAYPIYDLNYKTHLSVVKNYLDSFENLFYIGRPGRFLYTNQDHSLEMGIAAAQSIINSTRINLDEIGVEKEYFEKEKIPYEQPKMIRD